jgi:hypothetical protein
MYNWVVSTFILNEQFLAPLSSILFALPSQLLAPASAMAVLLALFEIPALPLLIIYVPNSVVYIMLITTITGILGAANLYVNYRFLINNWSIYQQIPNFLT